MDPIYTHTIKDRSYQNIIYKGYLQNGKLVEYTGLTNISIRIKEKHKEHIQFKASSLHTLNNNQCLH
jgi:hypothetical protein